MTKAMTCLVAAAVLSSAAPLLAAENPAADACPIPAPAARIQVLVELADTPALRVYERALASASTAAPAVTEAEARAAERAQDQKIKEAQAAAGRELGALGARELYRVRRSFNGIAVVLGADRLDAVRALPGVKAVYPRSRDASAAVGPASGTPTGSATVTAGAAGLRAYVDPSTGRLTAAPTEAQVRGIDESLDVLANRSSDGLAAVTLPDGTEIVDLQGRFRSLSTATISATGSVRLDCVEGRGPAATRPSSPSPEKE
jgi:hypothetical protein